MVLDQIQQFALSLKLTLSRRSETPEEEEVVYNIINNRGTIAATSIQGNNLRWKISPFLCCVLIMGAVQPAAGLNVFAGIGQRVLLPCFTLPAGIPKATVYWQNQNWVVLHWMKGMEHPQYQDRRYQNRTHIDGSEFLKGNLSLTIRDLQQDDAGEYQCIVKKKQDITPDKYIITLIVNITAEMPRIPNPMGLANITKTNGTETGMRERHHYYLITCVIIIGILVIILKIWQLRRC